MFYGYGVWFWYGYWFTGYGYWFWYGYWFTGYGYWFWYGYWFTGYCFGYWGCVHNREAWGCVWFSGFGFEVESVDDYCSEAVGVSPGHDDFVLDAVGDFGIDDDGSRLVGGGYCGSAIPDGDSEVVCNVLGDYRLAAIGVSDASFLKGFSRAQWGPLVRVPYLRDGIWVLDCVEFGIWFGLSGLGWR